MRDPDLAGADVGAEVRDVAPELREGVGHAGGEGRVHSQRSQLGVQINGPCRKDFGTKETTDSEPTTPNETKDLLIDPLPPRGFESLPSLASSNSG